MSDLQDDHNGEEDSKKSAATTLVEMAQQGYEFGVSTTGDAFAIPRLGPRLVAMLRGSKTSLRKQLAKDFFHEHHRTASQAALTDALTTIEGYAQEEVPQELFIRVASDNGTVWIDMGNLTGDAIEVSRAGWVIHEKSPMLFKRTQLSGELPEPDGDGNLEELWGLLNVAINDRPLVAAWLVATLIHGIPHPVLSLFGEQGTGKTTAQRMLVTTIDPGPVPIRKPPRDPDSWVTAAQGSWFVGIDNLSDVPPWLSDSICRAVTGDGDVRRKLYTDGEHAVFAFRRCICINGIDLGATRGDLAERMLPITLDRISESSRKSEEEIWAQWNQAHPRILGAILNLAVEVVAALPSVELASKPRMADFAKILAVVDSVLGTQGLNHYLRKLENLAADSLTSDRFILAVMQIEKIFNGPSADLLADTMPERPPRGWPKTPRDVTTRLKRHGPALRKAGWGVEHDDGHNKDKTLEWTLTPPEIERISPPPDPHAGSNGGLAGAAGEESGTTQNVPCPQCDGEGCEWCLCPDFKEEDFDGLGSELACQQ